MTRPIHFVRGLRVPRGIKGTVSSWAPEGVGGIWPMGLPVGLPFHGEFGTAIVGIGQRLATRSGGEIIIVDLQPPTPRDINGIQGSIWEEVSGQDYSRPANKPVTLAAYESGTSVRVR